MQYLLSKEEVNALRAGKSENVSKLIGDVFAVLLDLWKDRSADPMSWRPEPFWEWGPVLKVKAAYKEFCSEEKLEAKNLPHPGVQASTTPS